MLYVRLFFILFSLSFSLCAKEPLSIVIIGGGPTGLATAIEAKETGAQVCVVEKRKQYTREQYVFLFGSSLQLLEEWSVEIPDLEIGEDGEEEIGFTQIRKLEEGLAKRVKELGIPIIYGDFKGIRKKSAVILFEGKESYLPYDILVGADGSASRVRTQLGIETRLFGAALGLIAITNIKNSAVAFVEPFWEGSLFLNKVSIPAVTIISGQADHINRKDLAAAALKQGWVQEAKSITSNNALFFDDIEIVLQQSAKFSSSRQAAILVGDAAATASFLQGMGANSALEEAKVAGLFFQSRQKNSDYESFEASMKIITDKLIGDSAFLFSIDIVK